MNKFVKFSLVIILFSIISIISFSCLEKEEKIKIPKYIFLFIGDGMGSTHVALTEAYKANINGQIGFEKLTMTNFPAFGQCKTYCKNRQITDSGAAGSAIACGEKAMVETISYYENTENNNTKSIAKIAHENGLKVGILTTVSIDHATPAAFYAISKNRSSYYEIGLQLPENDFDFFGGGGFYYPNGKTVNEKSLTSIAQESGYKIYNELKDISKEDEKVVFINPVLLPEGEMPYAIDRENYGGANLADIVKSGINFLENPDGFFMMVEGGKIDWASHENDAATIINEIIDFDNAIAEAYKFYLNHPDETLIIVTADHETGGISMGIGANYYESNFAILNDQKCSQSYLASLISSYKKNTANYQLQDIFNIVERDFYQTSIEFTEAELKLINNAFDYYFYNKTNLTGGELYNLYGGYNPISITFTNILNNRASVGFSSRSHTGADVPVYSVGVGCDKFSGSMNNIEIKEKIAQIKNW